jgi:hypothetical protein
MGNTIVEAGRELQEREGWGEVCGAISWRGGLDHVGASESFYRLSSDERRELTELVDRCSSVTFESTTAPAPSEMVQAYVDILETARKKLLPSNTTHHRGVDLAVELAKKEGRPLTNKEYDRVFAAVKGGAMTLAEVGPVSRNVSIRASGRSTTFSTDALDESDLRRLEQLSAKAAGKPEDHWVQERARVKEARAEAESASRRPPRLRPKLERPGATTLPKAVFDDLDDPPLLWVPDLVVLVLTLACFERGVVDRSRARFDGDAIVSVGWPWPAAWQWDLLQLIVEVGKHHPYKHLANAGWLEASGSVGPGGTTWTIRVGDRLKKELAGREVTVHKLVEEIMPEGNL